MVLPALSLHGQMDTPSGGGKSGLRYPTHGWTSGCNHTLFRRVPCLHKLSPPQNKNLRTAHLRARRLRCFSSGSGQNKQLLCLLRHGDTTLRRHGVGSACPPASYTLVVNIHIAPYSYYMIYHHLHRLRPDSPRCQRLRRIVAPVMTPYFDWRF